MIDIFFSKMGIVIRWCCTLLSWPLLTLGVYIYCTVFSCAQLPFYQMYLHSSYLHLPVSHLVSNFCTTVSTCVCFPRTYSYFICFHPYTYLSYKYIYLLHPNLTYYHHMTSLSGLGITRWSSLHVSFVVKVYISVPFYSLLCRVETTHQHSCFGLVSPRVVVGFPTANWLIFLVS